MLENLRKLEEWYESVKGSKNLSLDEAKVLTKKMLVEADIEQKRKVREELFFGTIYKLYENLKNSYFIYQNSSEIDIDDIISESCERWFNYCSEGKILEIENYIEFFRNFFRSLNGEIFKTNFPFGLLWGITKKDLIKYCAKYVLYRKEFDSFSYLEFQKLLPEINAWEIYYAFEKSYIEIERMHLLEKEKKVTQRKLEIFLPYLLYCYINTSYNPMDKTSSICMQEADDDYIEIENTILREQVRTIFNGSDGINIRRKHILEAFVGLNGSEPKSLTEIGKEYNFSCERARTLKYEATRYFRNKKHIDSNNLRRIYDDYDFTK